MGDRCPSAPVPPDPLRLHAAIRKFDIEHPENAASIPYMPSKCLTQLHYPLLFYLHLINASQLVRCVILIAISVVKLLLLSDSLC